MGYLQVCQALYNSFIVDGVWVVKVVCCTANTCCLSSAGPFGHQCLRLQAYRPKASRSSGPVL